MLRSIYKSLTIVAAIVAFLVVNITNADGLDITLKNGFNKVGDTSTDDSKYLQNLIDDAAKGDKLVKLSLNKVYNLQHPLYFKSNIVFDGNGSTLIPAVNWVSLNKTDMPVLIISQQSNVKLTNFTLDIQGQKRQTNQRVYCSLLMIGAKKCTVDNVVFKNGGLLGTSKSIPNSPHIMIASQDAANDVNSMPVAFRNILASSSNNVISNCKFLNPTTYARFCIRVLTNWALVRNHDAFVNKTEGNTITGNYFLGEYPWNTVELAGGGVVNNTIQKNLVDGRSVNNLDIDKGASYNVIKDNKVINAGLPSILANDVTSRCSPIMVHGSAKVKYYAINNRVENNIIQNVSNPVSSNSKYAYSSAIGASTVDGLKITNNQILNVYQDKNYKNGAVYGGGIVLDDICKNVQITGNKLDKVNFGIVYTNNGIQINNISIDSNIINSSNTAIMIPLTLKGQSDEVSVKNNQIKGNSARKNIAIKVGNFKTKKVLDNIISN